MNPLMITTQTKWIAYAVSLVFACYIGWTLNGWKYEAKIAAQLKLQIAEKAKSDLITRDVVVKYQEVQGKERVVYQTIKDKINDIKTDNVCFSPESLSLWNASISGTVPKDTAGTTEATTGTDTATSKELLDNANQNFEQYAECRSIHEAIRNWDAKTYPTK
jgi:hypothetical protein